MESLVVKASASQHLVTGQTGDEIVHGAGICRLVEKSFVGTSLWFFKEACQYVIRHGPAFHDRYHDALQVLLIHLSITVHVSSLGIKPIALFAQYGVDYFHNVGNIHYAVTIHITLLDNILGTHKHAE